MSVETGFRDVFEVTTEEDRDCGGWCFYCRGPETD